jgi:hypothetical protein
MIYIVTFLGGFCVFLYIRCIRLENKIHNVGQERRDWVDNNLKILYTQLYDHTHDPTTGYVDRTSIASKSKEECS